MTKAAAKTAGAATKARARKRKAAVAAGAGVDAVPVPAPDGAAGAGAPPLTPLDYLLMVLRDETASATARMNAAKCAAPYVHARLASTEFKAPGLDKIGDAMAGLLKRAQESGGGVAGLVKV